MKHARIMEGALAGQDFTYKTWPERFKYGKPDIVFEVSPTGHGRYMCTAPYFGGDPYVNGPLYVDQKDLIPVDKLDALADCTSKLLAQGIITVITAEQMRAALEALAKPENLDEQATLQEGNEEA